MRREPVAKQTGYIGITSGRIVKSRWQGRDEILEIFRCVSNEERPIFQKPLSGKVE